MKKIILLLIIIFGIFKLVAQDGSVNNSGFLQSIYNDSFKQDSVSNPFGFKNWTDRIKIDGYLQFRGNAKSNTDLKCEQCDATYGGEKGFSLRRLRIKFSGWIHPQIYFYIQPDFASDGKNLGQLRDGYFDVYLDKLKKYRFRIGQSKIMYGFDNLQSSQNRIPLDRSDPINSAFKNERDMMVAFYYASPTVQKRFKTLIDKGLKGSGDYGVFGIGIFNGQTANATVPDNNGSFHVATRLTYPFEFANGQYLETSIQGYYGKYQLTSTTEGVIAKGRYDDFGNPLNAQDAFFDDYRVAASVIYYPQPIGFQMEYNIGNGPEYSPMNNWVEQQNLNGGYLSIIGNVQAGKHKFYPFMRFQYYDGGKKFELDARSYNVKEFEIGSEWSPFYPFEIALNYTYAERRFEDGVKTSNFQTGHLLRMQIQINY
ncbi:porin [Gaetbulibacter saemankumensis]|uniref:porin n=1 Tax=Gaetbulibacter saemankumensis TaxID=311208 RepID=UPI000402A35C|nr:porin [Gaetbulibacter saemankumensis]